MNKENRYSMIRSTLSDPVLGRYVTYGVQLEGDGSPGVADVSPEREEVERLIERMNREGVEPCHMMDVIEDFLLGGV